ncbi:MAG: hypothetical protein ACR2PT_00385 [Endozoicomonas sp.]
MVPGLYQRLHQGVKEARELIKTSEEDTQAGIDHQGRLVTALASYGDLYLPWGRGNPEAERLCEDLTDLMDIATELEEQLSLSQHTVTVVENHELDPNNLNLKQVSKDLVEVLQTPACFLIRTRENLFRLVSELLETNNTEQAKQKLREELELGFNRFLSVCSSDSTEEDRSSNVLATFLTAMSDWRTGLAEELAEDSQEEGQIEAACKVFDEVLATFNRSSYEKLSGKPSPHSTPPPSDQESEGDFATPEPSPPKQNSDSDETYETPPPEPEAKPETTPPDQDSWSGYSEREAAELRAMDALLQLGDTANLKSLLEQIESNPQTAKDFLEIRASQLSHQLSGCPDLLFDQLKALNLSKYDIPSASSQRPGQKGSLQQIVIGAIKNLKDEAPYRAQLQACNTDTAALVLFIRQQQLLKNCKPSHLEQAAWLLQQCPDKEQMYVRLLSRKNQSSALFTSIHALNRPADNLRVTDFSRDPKLIATFIQQYPAAVAVVEGEQFSELLTDPKLDDTWKKLLSTSTGFSAGQWQMLTAGSPPPLHSILENCLHPPATRIQVHPSAIDCVKQFLHNRPDAVVQLIQTPCKNLYQKLDSSATLLQIAHGIIHEDPSWLPRHKDLPGVGEYLVNETTRKLEGKEPVKLTTDLMNLVSENWSQISAKNRRRVFTSLTAPDPALTTAQQNEIVALLCQNREMLTWAVSCLDFPAVLQSPWKELPVASDRSGREQMNGLILMAVDQQPLPAPPGEVRDTPEDRLTLTVWFRKHRHLIFRNSEKDARHPAIPTRFLRTSPHEQFMELLLFRLSHSHKARDKSESLATLTCCAFSDEMLLEFLQTVQPVNLRAADRVFIATHRSREVAAEMIRSFQDQPDEEAFVAITQLHPGIVPENIWRTLPQKAQMRLAECDQTVARALLSSVLPLPQRAWLHAHCTPPTLELLDEWRAVCSDPDLDPILKQQWLLALEQLAATDDGARTMAGADFPWPDGDRLFKGQIIMKVIEHNPLLFRADMIADLKTIRRKEIIAYEELGAILARHYGELKWGELAPEVFLTLPTGTRTSLVRLNEEAALDHWKSISSSDAIEQAVNCSLQLSLAVLELLQDPEQNVTLPIARQKLFDMLLHCPHPEIKRRMMFIELEGLLTPEQVESQIDAALEPKLEEFPQLGLLQTNQEIRRKLVGMVQMGEGTAQGLLEDMEEFSERSIRELFADARTTTVEASLGFMSLMQFAKSPATAKKASCDQLLRGAIKFEAVAKEFLESTRPELQAFRDTIGEEKQLGIIGCHSQLSLNALKSGKPAGVPDETKIRWAARHPAVARELLLQPAHYLQNEDALKREHVVLMLRHNKDTCQKVLDLRRYQAIRDKLQPQDYVAAARKQDEIAQFLIAAPGRAKHLNLEDRHLIEIAKHRSSLLEHYISEPTCHPILLSVEPSMFIELAGGSEGLAGKLMKLGYENGKVSKHQFVTVAESSAACRQSILQHLPADIKDEIQAELAPKEEVSVELPAPETKEKHYMGNLRPFRQGKEFGVKEVNKGCCAGFAIDFCLYASALGNVPEDYVRKRDHWQVNKTSSDYMRRVRHYQLNQRTYAEKKKSKTINIDTPRQHIQTPNASIITDNGKSRLDMPALITEVRQHGGVYINSTDHAIALTLRPNFNGSSTLYLFDANHGLYRFDNFVEAPEQMDDVEALMNNWLMRTGHGELKVQLCHLADHAYTTPGISSETPET